MSPLVLKAVELRKVYKNTKKRALDGLSIEVEASKVFGILGPNGAGKSTFLKTLVGLLKADSGELNILGCSNPVDALPSIGYAPEDSQLCHYLTGRDFLSFIGGLRKIPKKNIELQIDKYKDILELPDLNHLISSYSKGNKEKILLLSSLIHSPKLLILDEPFTGLDPVVFKKVKDLIINYAGEGNTVILSTHILEVVSQLCNEIAIIKNGKIEGSYLIKNDNDIDKGFSEIEAMYLSTVKGCNTDE